MTIENENLIAAELKSMLPFFDLIHNGVLLTDKHSKILYANPFATKISGYSNDEIVGQHAGFNRSGYHDENFYKAMWTQLLSDGFWEGEIWNRTKAGGVYPSLLTINAIKSHTGEVINYISIFSDITFLKSDKEKQINLVYFDPLTKLPNQLAIKSNFIREAQNIARKLFGKKDVLEKIPQIAILFFDLNKFKIVNNTHGHVVGDKLLVEIADRLRKLSRTTDMIGRFGGDKFVAIIPNVFSESEITLDCDRILTIFQEPFNINDITIYANVSIGVSVYPDDAHDLEKLLKMADEAMYYAKKNKTNVMIYKNLPLIE